MVCARPQTLSREGLTQPVPSRQGDTAEVLRHLDSPKSRLPPRVRTAARQVVQQHPPFHPMSDWTILSQLHGPQVTP